jgi:hypothetical protein
MFDELLVGARTHEHQIFKRIGQSLPGANDAQPLIMCAIPQSATFSD